MTNASDREVILLAIDVVRDDIAEVKADVCEIKRQATLTNGRLRSVELWRHGLEAVVRAHIWVKPAVVAFMSGAGIAVLSWALVTL